MPRYSKKHYKRKDLYNLFIGSAVNSGTVSNEALNWLYMNQALKEQRYLFPRTSISRSNWASNVLPFLSDLQFRVALRIDCHSFQHIRQLIQNDPVFSNQSNLQTSSGKSAVTLCFV